MAIVDGEVCLISISMNARRDIELETSLQLHHGLLRILSTESLVTTY
jgi:hypothetical protein